MNELENLREISDRALSGLQAGGDLKHRIRVKALEEGSRSPMQQKLFRFVPVLLSAVAIMVLCVLLLNGKAPVFRNQEDGGLIHSFSAGDSCTESLSFESFMSADSDTVVSFSFGSAAGADDSALVARLTDLLKKQSVPLQDVEEAPNGELIIHERSGNMYRLPAEAPYIQWADGVRECKPFFDLLLQ